LSKSCKLTLARVEFTNICPGEYGYYFVTIYLYITLYLKWNSTLSQLNFRKKIFNVFGFSKSPWLQRYLKKCYEWNYSASVLGNSESTALLQQYVALETILIQSYQAVKLSSLICDTFKYLSNQGELKKNKHIKNVFLFFWTRAG